MLRVAIIGQSRTGSALAKAVRESKRYELVAHVAARSGRIRATTAEVIIVAVKDDRIREVAERALALAPEARLMVHLAGSLPPDVLPKIAGMDRLMLHPIQTFAKRSSAPFEGISWAACGSPKALAWGKRFTKALGSEGFLVLKPRDLALYHTISVFAANFPVLLGVAVEAIAGEIGLSARQAKAALAPLVEQVLANMAAAPSASVLSGPIRRGDVDTIGRHRQALQKLDPALWRIYDSFLGYARENGLFGEPSGNGTQG
jgi:predicted short-subunit dehydrogenase-like oxidoreductase (DUF2520 family)